MYFLPLCDLFSVANDNGGYLQKQTTKRNERI